MTYRHSRHRSRVIPGRPPPTCAQSKCYLLMQASRTEKLCQRSNCKDIAKTKEMHDKRTSRSIHIYRKHLVSIAGYVIFNKKEAGRSRDNRCTNVTNDGSTCRTYVSHVASFPVPVECQIVRNVQSVRTYVMELAKSNTPIVIVLTRTSPTGS